MQKIYFLTFLLLVLFTSTAAGQPAAVTGNVKDGENGQPVIGAYVIVKPGSAGTVTDSLGNFKLSLSPGRYTATISYIGYNTLRRDFTVRKEGLTGVQIILESNTRIEDVIVMSGTADENITRPDMGVDRLTAVEIRRMPTLLGEVDVLKAIQLMPGVQATSEGSSGFSVRGGAPDQNLILLDNTTVYNASHLLGFFSVFNHDVVNSVDLYKGDLPLKHGGRLSSVLDVQTKNKMPQKFGGTGGIGLISSRIMLEGPAGDRTSWLVGGRRSYADLFLKLAKDESLRQSIIYFYDLNAKATHRISQRDMLELSGYYGRDRYGAQEGLFAYGNTAVSLSWRHIYNTNLLSRTSVHFSNYDYFVGSELEGMEVDWRSGITDVMLRIDFEHYISGFWNLSYGLSSTFHSFRPGDVKMGSQDDFSIIGSNALEHGLYVSNEQKIGDRLTLKYGVRLSVFQNMGYSRVYHFDEAYEVADSTDYRAGRIYNTYPVAEPRAGFVYRISDRSSVKGNYARNAQFIQIANNSASGSPLDVWFPAGPNVKPQKSQIFSLGYFHNFDNNMYETSAEIYYKDMRNVIDFKEHANLLLDGKLDGEIRTGKGKAYGIELMVKKNSGRLNGFVNYTLSRSERTIPEINGGKTYLAPFDRTHTVNISLNYEISRKLSASLTWIYGTGTPTTYPVGRFEIQGEAFPIYSGRNEFRLPDYHRLDLSLNYVPRPGTSKRFRGEWNLSVYNAYNKKNPWIISFRQTAQYGTPYAEMTYLFGIVPSITYNFSF